MPQLSNKDTALFLDVSSTSTPSYKRLGEGVTGAVPSSNPTIQTKHYIHMAMPKHDKTAINKQYALAMERYKGDSVNDYIFSLDEVVGEGVKTKLIVVDMTSGTNATPPVYDCKVYDATIVVNNPGSLEGGNPQAMDVTIYIDSAATEDTCTIATDTLTLT